MSTNNPPRKKEIMNKVRKWMTEEFFAIKSVPDIDSDLNLEITFGPDDSRHVNVGFPRKSNDAIFVMGGVRLTDDRRADLQGLRLQEKSEFLWVLRFALVTRDVAYNFSPSMENLETIKIYRNVFFDGLTKEHLMEVIGIVYLSITTALWTIEKRFGASAPTDERMLSWRR